MTASHSNRKPLPLPISQPTAYENQIKTNKQKTKAEEEGSYAKVEGCKRLAVNAGKGPSAVIGAGVAAAEAEAEANAAPAVAPERCRAVVGVGLIASLGGGLTGERAGSCSGDFEAAGSGCGLRKRMLLSPLLFCVLVLVLLLLLLLLLLPLLLPLLLLL